MMNLQISGTAFTPSGHSDYREGFGTIRANGGDNGGGSEVLIAFSSKDHGADAGELSPTLRAQNFKDSHINGGGQVAIAFHENKSGQLTEADVLGLRSGASHSYQGVGGNFGVRRLTPRECERLQGFPDDFTRYDANQKEISDSARYRMLGNAVAVPVAQWIGSRIEASA
jgi:DNA (cytosine-5)-methyltransferase 1